MKKFGKTDKGRIMLSSEYVVRDSKKSKFIKNLDQQIIKLLRTKNTSKWDSNIR